MNRPAFWRRLALGSYLGLLAWILLWHAVLKPAGGYPVALVLIVLLVPLLAALRGMLHGRRYTHQWIPLLSLFYFSIGVMDAYADPAARAYGLIVTGLSLLLFTAAIGYVRTTRPASS